MKEYRETETLVINHSRCVICGLPHNIKIGGYCEKKNTVCTECSGCISKEYSCNECTETKHEPTRITASTVMTKEMIDQLKPGDMLPNCFNSMQPITRIFAKGVSEVDGKTYACLYQKFYNGEMSASVREGQKPEVFFNLPKEISK